MCKLNKTLYGLKQAFRAWFEKLKGALVAKDFRNSSFDNNLFIHYSAEEFVYLLVYVDNILITGNDFSYIQNLVKDLHQTFALKNLGELSYFLGFEVIMTSVGTLLTQSKYAINLLKRVKMFDAKSSSTLIAANTKLSRDGSPLFDNPTLYRSLIGGLQYLTMTRPYLCFVVNRLSQFLLNLSVTH